MKTKIITLISVLLLGYANINKLQAEEDKDQPKSVVKLNLEALFFKNISLQYEYAFHKNFSGAFQFGFMLIRPLPNRFQSAGQNFSDLRFSGFNCAPEIRIYPGKKQEKPAPRGFYIAPYARYSNYKLTANFLYFDSAAVPPQSVPVEFQASFKGFGAGIMLGAQFIISKKVSIDWWILGGHFGFARLSGYMDSQLVQDNQYDFYEQLEDLDIGFGTKTFEVKGSRASISLDGIPFGGVRTGLCLGFAF